MSVYLRDIPLEEAQSLFDTALREAGLGQVLGIETIPLNENALDRVLVNPIWARICSPHYHACAMDGFAVRSTDTVGAQPSAPVRLSVGPNTCYVDTGDPLPDGCDAVIPVENAEVLDEIDGIIGEVHRAAHIRIRAAVPPWTHVRPMGEDIIATQLILPSGHRLRPVDLGAIAAAGHHSVNVASRPKVAILPTGSELVPIGSNLKAGDILEYNSLVMAAQVCSWGGEATRFPGVPDVLKAIVHKVQQAAQSHDLILIIAGSSAGSEDFSARVVEELGMLIVHGVAIRPGHPVILGMIRKNNKKDKSSLVPIIGIPGYPVSAALTGEIFVEPLLARWTGRHTVELPIQQAILSRKITSPAGDDDYVRVSVGRVGDRIIAAPLSRGAGVITSLIKADGITILPRGIQGIDAGAQVKVRLYCSQRDLERTIFCSGSHDLTLDLIGQYLAGADRKFISSNIGSQGGLIALKRGEAHLAGCHLLDSESGEYNISYLEQYLSGMSLRLVGLVGREQGLLVKKGNPMGLKCLEDLTQENPKVYFINRQRGSGTRVLLDYHLDQSGIARELIRGYNQEEYTHLGVAAAIASGRADCGLGIKAAAQTLDLEFIPLFQERYDLVIPGEHIKSGLLAPLFDLLNNPNFQNSVKNMPGYDVTVMGKVILEV